MHETTNVGSGCAGSITYQWDDPAPTIYIREQLTTISVSEEMLDCWPRYAIYATLHPHVSVLDSEGGGDAELTAGREDVARRRLSLDATPAAVDGDGDGAITRRELRVWFEQMPGVPERLVGSVEPATIAARGGAPAVADEMLTALVDSAFSYHDTDGNGRVTVAELAGNIERWRRADVAGHPAREVARLHRAYESSTCTFPDMVPTWAGAPDMAHAPPPPECAEHIALYRQLLRERGLLPQGRAAAGAGAGAGGDEL